MSETAGKLSLQQTFARYGKVAIALHVGLSILSTTGCYIAISQGLDLRQPLERIGLLTTSVKEEGVEDVRSWVPESLGVVGPNFAAAYVCNKALMPVRTPLTITLTPFIARWVQKLKSAAR